MGDDADQPGYDMTAYWARSGMMSAMHYADAEPAPSPPDSAIIPTSMALFGGIMLGLYQSRDRTGQGMNVNTSLLANGAWANACAIQGALVGAQVPTQAHPRYYSESDRQSLRHARPAALLHLLSRSA